VDGEAATTAMRAARARAERVLAADGAGPDCRPALSEAAAALRAGEDALARCLARKAAPGDGRPRADGAVREIAELRVASESLDTLLAHLSAYVVDALDRAGGASVTLLAPGSLGATDAAVEAADRVQYTLREGPCYEALRTGEARWTGAADGDPRWPRLSAAMRADGRFSSILAIPLHTEDGVEGVLNVYARQGDAFDETSRRIAGILGRPIAATLSDARAYSEQTDLVAGLRQATESHSRIGQAVGILIVRDGVGADEAFARLRRMSNDTNRKLRDVAAAIVTEATPGEAKPKSTA